MKTRPFRPPPLLRMSILTIVVLVILSIAPLTARAQAVGQISGIVTNGTTGQPVPSIEVTLSQFTTDGLQGDTTTTTAADGSYTYDDVDTADGIVYAASVSYSGVLYSTGMIRFQGTTEQSGTITTYETTSDANVVTVESRGIVLAEVSPDSGEATVLDIVALAVNGNQTFVTGDDGRSIEFPVPRNATDITPAPGFDFGTPTIDNSTVFATSPLRPEGGSATLNYLIPYTGHDFAIELRNAYPTEIVRILVPSDLTDDTESIGVRSTGFQDAGTAMIGEREYHVWVGTAMERDSSVRVTFTDLPESASEANRLRVLEPAIIAILALIAAAGVTLWFIRKRKLPALEPAVALSDNAAMYDSREELVVQLQELQDEHENGMIDDEQYLSERHALLERLRIVSRQLREQPPDDNNETVLG